MPQLKTHTPCIFDKLVATLLGEFDSESKIPRHQREILLAGTRLTSAAISRSSRCWKLPMPFFLSFFFYQKEKEVSTAWKIKWKPQIEVENYGIYWLALETKNLTDEYDRLLLNPKNSVIVGLSPPHVAEVRRGHWHETTLIFSSTDYWRKWSI